MATHQGQAWSEVHGMTPARITWSSISMVPGITTADFHLGHGADCFQQRHMTNTTKRRSRADMIVEKVETRNTDVLLNSR